MQRASHRLTRLEMGWFGGALWTDLMKDLREKKRKSRNLTTFSGLDH